MVFLGVQCEYSDSDIVVVPVPFEGSVSYNKGTSEGPGLIMKASEHIEAFDLELGEFSPKAHTLDAVNADSAEHTIDAVYKAAKQVLADGKFPVVLGGDHSVSVGAVEAAVEKFPGLTVLQIDAHADLRDEYDGSRFSHACTARRMHEFGARLVQAGVRSLSREEHDFIEENRTRVFYAPVDFDRVLSVLGKDVYITIDSDGFDPSVMPGTGTPVPGGLLWHETLGFLRQVFRQSNVVGLDFVELLKGAGTVSEDAAALLIYRLLGYKHGDKSTDPQEM